MDEQDLAAIERLVTQAIAEDPRSAFLLLIAVAQAWGECLYALEATLDDLEANNAGLDDTFSFVPESIRTAVKTYTLIGYQLASEGPQDGPSGGPIPDGGGADGAPGTGGDGG